jgi:anaerobic ribonucleoside-triphosphate reductase
MAGLVKDCSVCERPFTATSLKAGLWETRCSNCEQEKRRTFAERGLAAKIDTTIASVEKRLDQLEQAIEVIPMLVGGEVSNALGNITGEQGLAEIKEALTKAVELKISELEQNALKAEVERDAEMYNFKQKLQSQIVTLNNKIINIMREME